MTVFAAKITPYVRVVVLGPAVVVPVSAGAFVGRGVAITLGPVTSALREVPALLDDGAESGFEG